MRLIIWLLVLAWSSPAAANDPYDVISTTFGFGLGASPELSGDIADRMAREECGSTCPLSVQWALRVGAKRWGLDLQLTGSPLIDEGAADYRDRDRNALRGGPLLRYSLLRGFGFDLSVRGGVHFGAVTGSASSTTTPDPNCPVAREGMCDPLEMTYDPESYSLVALPLGATLRLGARSSDGGFFAIYADFDYTLVRIGFPDDPRTGALRTIMYGFMFGMMHDM